MTVMSCFSARSAAFAALLVLPCGFAAGQQSDNPVYNDRKASEWLNALQNDTSTRQRALAAAALGKIWSQHLYKKALTEGLGRSLRLDSSAAVRAQCASVLAGLKQEHALVVDTDIVEAAKKEKDARVRRELAVVLSRFPEIAKKSVEPLTNFLKDEDAATRTAAADALARAGGDAKGAAPVLIGLLGDADKGVRQSAIFALGRVEPENPSFAAAALIQRLDAEKEADLRRDIVVSLKLLGDRSEPVVTALIRAIGDKDAEITALAVRTLGTFGPAGKSAADSLLKVATTTKDKGLRVDAVRSFGSVLGPDLKSRAKDLIGVMETDADFEVRLAAVEEIAALGNEVKDDKDVMTALRKRLSDPQVKVREAAAAAIRRIEKKPEPPAKKP
jgi:HEAT repeat protein